MQSRSIGKLVILAAMAVIATLSVAPAARADLLTVTGQDNGGPVVSIINQSGTLNSALGIVGSNASATVGVFTVQVQGATAQQTDNTQSLATGSASKILYTSPTSITTAHTIQIVITATGFTGPLSGAIDSFIGGSVPTGSATSSMFSSNVGGVVVTNTLPSSISGSFSSDASGTAASLTSPYSITETITFTLTPGTALTSTTINYASSTKVTTAAVPEPATVAMALTALPLLGIGAWARRRRARA